MLEKHNAGAEMTHCTSECPNSWGGFLFRQQVALWDQKYAACTLLAAALRSKPQVQHSQVQGDG